MNNPTIPATTEWSMPQKHALIQLAFHGGEVASLTKVLKPELKAKDRRPLEQGGLVESAQKTRGSRHLVLTETGWRWVMDNLATDLPGRDSVSLILGVVDRYLRRNEMSLHDLLNGESKSRAGNLEELVVQEALRLGDGRITERIRLRKLRPMLSPSSREDQDDALRRLQQQEIISLIRIDLPSDYTIADEEAAIRIGGEARHALILRK